MGWAWALVAGTFYQWTFNPHLLAGRELLAGHVARGPFAPTARYGRETTRRLEVVADS